ncbi:MAG: hypothetical protein FRC54_05395 [bacterium LCO1.1]|uniref:Uncharacterized protein n=1 Tax=Candidatus Weimeria bifida TaxID=2599074 RepID=A0A6N7J166_9FIRM|nr:hypothetical protein [Candidatus Weimeria bifida]
MEAESTIIAGGKKNPHEVKQTVDQAAAVLIRDIHVKTWKNSFLMKNPVKSRIFI